MPKYNLSITLMDEKGEPWKDGNTVLTTGTVARRALLQEPIGQQLPAEEKFRRFSLWKKLPEAGEVDLTVDEAQLIKTCCIVFSVLAYGQMVEFLDQKA